MLAMTFSISETREINSNQRRTCARDLTNEMTDVNTIWKPAVRSTEVASTRRSVWQQGQVQTSRTSLKHNLGSSSNLSAVEARRQMNERILSASQLFNTTPKPFVKQWGLSEANNSSTPLKQQQQQAKSILKQPKSLLQLKEDQVSNMDNSPKLVHHQYNSPIDLYSMSNIRKTIEAHSEMIAPGVKGINFMKADAPVNKDSEVYRLVKEQEEEERRKRETGLERQPEANQANQQRVQYATERIAARGESTGSGAIRQTASNVKQLPIVSNGSSAADNTQPKCFECSQLIVGPFAKIQDHFIHPHCFNCSTCGTSLKNTGYFTINEKLYCDIHARQVADVMRLNYNFEPNKQAVVKSQQEVSEHHRSEPNTQQNLSQRKSPTSLLQQAQQRPQPANAIVTSDQTQGIPSLGVNLGPDRNSCCPPTQSCSATVGTNRATTISTMFTGTGNSCQQCKNHCGCNQRGEIRWTWRPAHRAELDSGGCQHYAPDNLVSSTSGSSSTAMVSNRTLTETRNRYESRLVSSAVGERVPICCHCHCQIFGPYIMAGKLPWCKPCSQSNFLCNSCNRSLLNIGFIEDKQTGKYNCEHCFETLLAPVCSKCSSRIGGDCLNALGKQWHPTCFVCGHCRGPFGNSTFYLEDNVPYCERDWNLLFTTKCYACGYPIQVGDKWIEALSRNYHSDCFRCTGCQVKLEGVTFYCKGGKPYCRMHAR